MLLIIENFTYNLLDTRGNDTRYFVVKSFNHDNVTMAQKDVRSAFYVRFLSGPDACSHVQELWATQKKNSEIFDDAFKTSRDVILVFSVNKSGKFQGYVSFMKPPYVLPTKTY